MKKLYGVTVAMITPFTEEGNVDVKALDKLTEMLISRGVNCLYPCGTTGEMVHLSEEERKTVAETVIRVASGRANVFIHCGAMTQKETENLVKHAYEAGADGVGVVTPMFLGVTDKEMTAYYEKISSLVPAEFPIYLYNIPQCSGNDLKKTTAEQITENCENVIGIKYSYPDMMRTLEYLEIPNFSVLHGCDKMFAELLLMGCDGTVSGVAGVFPEPFVAVYEAWKHKDIPAMQKWQKVCIKLCNLLRCGANMSWFKQALALRGLPVGGMRAPQQDLLKKETADTMKEIEEICKEAEIELKV